MQELARLTGVGASVGLTSTGAPASTFSSSSNPTMHSSRSSACTVTLTAMRSV